MKGVYCITNITNTKVYIGSTSNLSKRRTEHFYKLRKGVHTNKYLQQDYNLLGETNFAFSVLEYVTNLEELPTRELYYFSKFTNKYNIYKNPNYINVKGRNKIKQSSTSVNNGNFGNQHSNETKKLIRDNRWGENYQCKPKPKYKRKSEEEVLASRKRVSEYHKNKIVTKETRNKISKSRQGIRHNEETISKFKSSRKLENNANAKLTTKQMLEIQNSNLSAKELSKIYGVHLSHIYKIRKKNLEVK